MKLENLWSYSNKELRRMLDQVIEELKDRKNNKTAIVTFLNAKNKKEALLFITHVPTSLDAEAIQKLLKSTTVLDFKYDPKIHEVETCLSKQPKRIKESFKIDYDLIISYDDLYAKTQLT